MVIFDHDHSQNLTITMVTWSKWSILTIDHEKIEIVLVMVNFFDH